jgi:uncharacterized membrane protein YgdD (TMEM256/DUF423 family)
LAAGKFFFRDKMNSNKLWIITAGIAGFTGVALGAFGAHGLRNILSPELMQVYKTGVYYHLVHAVAILAIALTGKPKYFISAFFFALGILLFSFSLYLYSITGTTALAIITPFGGVSFLIGWLMLVVRGMKRD